MSYLLERVQNCPQSGIAGKRLCPGRVEPLHCIVGAGLLRDDSAVVVPELHLELRLLVGAGRPLEIVKLSKKHKGMHHFTVPDTQAE